VALHNRYCCYHFCFLVNAGPLVEGWIVCRFFRIEGLMVLHNRYCCSHFYFLANTLDLVEGWIVCRFFLDSSHLSDCWILLIVFRTVFRSLRLPSSLLGLLLGWGSLRTAAISHFVLWPLGCLFRDIGYLIAMEMIA